MSDRKFLISMEAKDDYGVIHKVNYWLTLIGPAGAKLTQAVLENAAEDWCKNLSGRGIICNPQKIAITFVLELEG